MLEQDTRIVMVGNWFCLSLTCFVSVTALVAYRMSFSFSNFCLRSLDFTVLRKAFGVLPDTNM